MSLIGRQASRIHSQEPLDGHNEIDDDKSGISNNIVKRLGKSGDGIMIVVATRPMKVLQCKVMNYSFYPLQRC